MKKPLTTEARRELKSIGETITDAQIRTLGQSLFEGPADARQLHGLVACHDALGRSHRRDAARTHCASLITETSPKSLLDWGPDGLYDDARATHLHGLCHAARDGECNWRECPQLKTYKRHCPLDRKTTDED